MRSEKLVWSRLCDDFTIQEHGAIRTEDLCHSDPDIMAASSHNKVQLNVAISDQLLAISGTYFWQ